MASASASNSSPETWKVGPQSLTVSWTPPPFELMAGHLSRSEWQRRQIVSFSARPTTRESRNEALWAGGISFALALLGTESAP